MRELRRVMVVLGVVAMGGVVGCGSQNDCNLTPPLSQNPRTCSGSPGSTVNVTVNWCTCGSSVTCSVRDEGGGVIQLEPVISSCDASCPANPVDCPARGVTCPVTVPGSTLPYHLYVYGAQNVNGYVDVPLNISGGASNTCT